MDASQQDEINAGFDTFFFRRIRMVETSVPGNFLRESDVIHAEFNALSIKN